MLVWCEAAGCITFIVGKWREMDAGPQLTFSFLLNPGAQTMSWVRWEGMGMVEMEKIRDGWDGDTHIQSGFFLIS